jgi:hypothetical protein
MTRKHRYPHRRQRISKISASSTRELVPTLCLSLIQTNRILVFLTLQPGLLEPVLASTSAVGISVTIPRATPLSVLVVTIHSHKGFHMQ